MPLYLEHLPAVSESFKDAHAIWEALHAIKFEVAEHPVSPRIAWKQACLHLRPLLPIEHRDVFAARSRPNWDTLLIAYAELVGRSKGDNIDLMNMATAVKVLHRHSTHPPRDDEAPPLVEVSYFIHMCDHAKLSLKKLSGGEEVRVVGLFRFCKYCWRTAISGRLICNDHASVLVDGDAKVTEALLSEAKTSASRRKQAYRLKLRFDAAISKLVTNEVMEFHQSEFKADVLLPEFGRFEWLERRRPMVARLLSELSSEINDANMAVLLLKLLHDPDVMQGVWKDTYLRFNSSVIEFPELIWPMLVRAEAWFIVRNETRKNWGGVRKNSGRLKVS